MDLLDFLKEENHLPKNEKIIISERFVSGDVAMEWEIRAITEGAYKQALKNGGDPWAVLCVESLVVPNLKDEQLQESYGVTDAQGLLKEMLYCGEYLKLVREVKKLNGFGERKKNWKQQAKNA